MIEVLSGIPVSQQKTVFGEMDEYAKQIEKTLRVTILTREEEVRIVGEDGCRMSITRCRLSKRTRRSP